jgi:hypothetical protein
MNSTKEVAYPQAVSSSFPESSSVS